MDRGAWKATCSLWGHKESDTTEHAGTHTRREEEATGDRNGALTQGEYA